MNLVTDVEVVIGGLLIVFIGMIAIVGLLYVISGVVKRDSSDGEKNEKDNIPAIAEINIAESVADDTAEVSDEELIAVISAAVAVYMGSDEKTPRFKVTSFKRVASPSRRS